MNKLVLMIMVLSSGELDAMGNLWGWWPSASTLAEHVEAVDSPRDDASSWTHLSEDHLRRLASAGSLASRTPSGTPLNPAESVEELTRLTTPNQLGVVAPAILVADGTQVVTPPVTVPLLACLSPYMRFFSEAVSRARIDMFLARDKKWFEQQLLAQVPLIMALLVQRLTSADILAHLSEKLFWLAYIDTTSLISFIDTLRVEFCLCGSSGSLHPEMVVAIWLMAIGSLRLQDPPIDNEAAECRDYISLLKSTLTLILGDNAAIEATRTMLVSSSQWDSVAIAFDLLVVGKLHS
jgi:hypothetical protein